MNIDEIAMFVLLIFMIIGAVVSIGTYLMILSVDMNKTDEERMLEDEEQMEYLRNYKKGGKKNGKKNK